MQQAYFPFEWVDLRTLGNEQSTNPLAALQFQHQFLRWQMQGALLPADIPLQGNEVILDLLCGPGNWCIDMSYCYPRAQIWGVDVSHAALDFAWENAACGSFSGLHFQRLDNPWRLPFADETFDVIHLQHGSYLFPYHQWPRLLTELARLLKPGGWLGLVDFQISFVSEPVVARLLTMFGQMLTHLDWRPSAKGMLLGALGLTQIAQQGFTDLGFYLSPVNLGGWPNQDGRTYLSRCLLRPEMIVALAERTGISTTEELRPLLVTVQQALHQFQFCGMGFQFSVVGRKPFSSATPSEAQRKEVVNAPKSEPLW